MRVEINLLPQKRKRSGSLPVILAALLLAAVMIIFTMFSLSQSIENDRTASEEELQELQMETTELENQITELQNPEQEELQARMDELDDKIVPVSVVLDEVVARMPEESVMTLFDYVFPDEIIMEAIILSVPDIARYQHALEDSPMIQRAEVDTVLGEEILEELEEDIFWYEDYLPQYFTTFEITLHPDAVRAFEEEPEEDEVELP
ncbi:hypothetical protein [Alkalicoccus chagannorensis]|uniref:hypothetical protein n=1 Tax=Alkalicoccus chagannorensis TaxID=427072 RepID=UPI0003F5432A|nr:hypothetical protein [Alkalicoccus chagannorensis]